ncbi:conserved protein of unknown function [Hyphomicrobium sp. 1Nfss2.1]|uniref:hypothetical protein n=1 Tax=Hyphomicrobium sp. 1Nfss2.1 TaxID=3413936 RepID=UPI003C7D37B8
MAKASTKSAPKARSTGKFVAPASAKTKTAVVERAKPAKATAAKAKTPAKKK